MQKTTGAPNGASRRAPFDRWLRYAAGFSPATLERCFEPLPDKPALLIDPFVGVATTGTRAVQRGYSFRGIEVHPLIAEVAALKFRKLPAETVRELRHLANETVDEANALSVDLQKETTLVRRCFDVQTLRHLVGLRETIKTIDSTVAPYLKCALIACLRDVANVKVGWPYQRPSVKRRPRHTSVPKRFKTRVGWLAEDLETLNDNADARIVADDARSATAWQRALDGAKAQACLSSPPYLNNFDYADATRLELYFMGSVRTWAELCAEVRAGMVAATTQQSTQRRAERGWEILSMAPRAKKRAETLSASLATERASRARGKEYDQMLPAYLGDILQVLKNSYASLTDGGVLAWVVGDSAPYGVYTDTPYLIGLLAEEVGFTPAEEILLRQRGSRWSANGTRHKKRLAEKLIVLTR